MSLSEEYIQDAFHSYLKSSLTQAKVEKLLDPELLSSAEGDLMISGPALCLYFAALRCTTNPPSVPLPRNNKAGPSGVSQPPLDLSVENCPQAFLTFLKVWAKTVPAIQSLSPEYQHDLARIICGLGPLVQPPEPSLGGIAADLRAVAIEISQRRSFQDRYASDLQAALDAGQAPGTSSIKVRASFVPPPSYEASSAGSSPQPSPQSATAPLPPPREHHHDRTGSHSGPFLSPPHSPSMRSHSRNSSHSSVSSEPPSPSFAQSASSIQLIRETLYAAIADILVQYPSIHALLKTDQTRAYFASVSLAILAVSTTNITPSGSVVGVLGQELTLRDCPRDLRPFMMELAAIGRDAVHIAEEDDKVAMDLAARGLDIPQGKLDRTKQVLLGGVGSERRSIDDTGGRRASLEGHAVGFANRINALSLGMTRLRAFRERQNEIFKVLSGVDS